jgi:hypothetical protein
MITAPAPSAAMPEAADDASPEETLRAALRVHASDLLEFAGQMTAELRQDGGVSTWLLRDMRRTVSRLIEALAEFDKEMRTNG